MTLTATAGEEGSGRCQQGREDPAGGNSWYARDHADAATLLIIITFYRSVFHSKAAIPQGKATIPQGKACDAHLCIPRPLAQHLASDRCSLELQRTGPEV